MGAAGAVAPRRPKARAARAVVTRKRSLRKRKKKKGKGFSNCFVFDHIRGERKKEKEKKKRGKKNLPLKSAKHDSSNNSITNPPITNPQIRPPDCQGNKGGKPKQHGDRIKRQHRNHRRQFREFQWGHKEVNSHDHCPYRHKDDEADFRRDIAVEGVSSDDDSIEPVCDC